MTICFEMRKPYIVHTADGRCVHTADAARLDSFVSSAVCIRLKGWHFILTYSRAMVQYDLTYKFHLCCCSQKDIPYIHTYADCLIKKLH